MSSYLNIYGRVRSDLYNINRIKDTEYHKQGDIILLDSYSRNSKLYSKIQECVRPVWAGEEEKYSVLTKEDIIECIEDCKSDIQTLKDFINNSIKERREYLDYLAGLGKILTYSEFLETRDTDNSGTEEEIKELEHCIHQLEFIQAIIFSSNIKCNGFSEILCNID